MKGFYVKLLFLSTATLLLSISILTYRNLNLYSKETGSARYANQILETLAGIVSSLEDAQTANHRYLQTNDSSFLPLYHESLQAITVQLKALDRFVDDDRQLSGMVDTLEQAITNQLAIITRTSASQISRIRAEQVEDSLLTEDWENREDIRNVTRRIRDVQHMSIKTNEFDGHFGNIAPIHLLIYGLVAIAGLAFLFAWVLESLQKRKISENLLNENIEALKKEVSIREFTQKTLRNVLDNSLNGIMAFKAIRNEENQIEDFEWILVNAVSMQLFGTSEEDILKKRLLDVIPKSMSEELVEVYKDVVETGKVRQFEKYYGTDDVNKWFTISAIRLGDGLVVTFSDITDQKLQLLFTEERELLLKEAEEVASMGSWKWTIKNDLLVWSDGLYRILGYTPGEHEPSWNLFMKNIFNEDRHSLEGFVNELKITRSGLKTDYRITLAGEIRHLSIITNAALKDDTLLPEILGTVIDITDRKTYENQLKQHWEELRRSNEDLEQFAYVASHDLQEPLRKIRAFGDRLVSKYQHNLEGSGTDYINRMQSAAARMQMLIEDLLAYSRLSRNANVLESLDMDALMVEVIDDLEFQVKREQAVVRVGKLPMIRADRMQIKRLFQNLLSNAIKFHKPVIAPVISIEGKEIGPAEMLEEYGVALSGNDYVCFNVKDNGIGFDEKYTDKIFHIFQRLHGRSEYEGTGIGLSICRKIVTNHGGFITARSKANDGAEFIVILPLEPIWL